MINGNVESIITGGTTNHKKYHVPHRAAGDEIVPRIHVFSTITLCVRTSAKCDLFGYLGSCKVYG
jgi:hypothetical protein